MVMTLQILRQFGELAPELEDMQKYAAWKAADINKALREGRTPTPGNGDAAPADLSLPGVPSHASEPPVPQVPPTLICLFVSQCADEGSVEEVLFVKQTV